MNRHLRAYKGYYVLGLCAALYVILSFQRQLPGLPDPQDWAGTTWYFVYRDLMGGVIAVFCFAIGLSGVLMLRKSAPRTALTALIFLSIFLIKDIAGLAGIFYNTSDLFSADPIGNPAWTDASTYIKSHSQMKLVAMLCATIPFIFLVSKLRDNKFPKVETPPLA